MIARIGRLPPFVVMIKPTDFREYNHIPQFPILNRSCHGATHFERQMRPVLVVVAEIFGQDSLEMSLVHDNHVVETFPAN